VAVVFLKACGKEKAPLCATRSGVAERRSVNAVWRESHKRAHRGSFHQTGMVALLNSIDVEVPAGDKVKITVGRRRVTVKGPLGVLKRDFTVR
jgi:hypothetical protein